MSFLICFYHVQLVSKNIAAYYVGVSDELVNVAVVRTETVYSLSNSRCVSAECDIYSHEKAVNGGKKRCQTAEI